MASSKDYLDFILEQLSELEEITHRAMMGEYVLYYRGRVFGGIYDDRFLVKPTKSAKAMMPDANMKLPYDGAKEMLLVALMNAGEGDISKLEGAIGSCDGAAERMAGIMQDNLS